MPDEEAPVETPLAPAEAPVAAAPEPPDEAASPVAEEIESAEPVAEESTEEPSAEFDREAFLEGIRGLKDVDAETFEALRNEFGGPQIQSEVDRRKAEDDRKQAYTQQVGTIEQNAVSWAVGNENETAEVIRLSLERADKIARKLHENAGTYDLELPTDELGQHLQQFGNKQLRLGYDWADALRQKQILHAFESTPAHRHLTSEDKGRLKELTWNDPNKVGDSIMSLARIYHDAALRGAPDEMKASAKKEAEVEVKKAEALARLAEVMPRANGRKARPAPVPNGKLTIEEANNLPLDQLKARIGL